MLQIVYFCFFLSINSFVVWDCLYLLYILSSRKNYNDQAAIRQATEINKNCKNIQIRWNAKITNNEINSTTLNISKTSRLYISKADRVRRFGIIPDFVFKIKASDGNNP